MGKNKKHQRREKEKWVNIIHKYRHEASSQFNKHIVYLNSGGLILTLGFTKDIVHIETAACKWMLILTWVLFSISLFLNLISYKSTMKAMDSELDGNIEESDCQDTTTIQIDRYSISCLGIAIILFVIFISINLLING